MALLYKEVVDAPVPEGSVQTIIGLNFMVIESYEGGESAIFLQ